MSRSEIRFWHYGTEDVLIKIRKGQTLRHSTGGSTDEGWSRESNIWHFDGETVTCQWCSDGRDCDGRLTRGGEAWFAAKDAKAGYDCGNGIRYPDWHKGEESRRDYAAEAAGY